MKGSQPPQCTIPPGGFVIPKLLRKGIGVGREKPNRGLCCGFYSQAVGRPELSPPTTLDASRPHPGRGEGGCWEASPTAHCPLQCEPLHPGPSLCSSEFLMDPLLVFVRFQLELIGGDLAILVAILILEHVSYGFLRILARQEAAFALTDLSLDEGGKLQRGESRGEGERASCLSSWAGLGMRSQEE